MHGQRALCFVGFIAELKVTSDQKPLHSSCSRTDWRAVVSTSTCHVLFTTTFFSWRLQVWCLTGFASSEYHVLLKFGLQDTLSYQELKKKVQHWIFGRYSPQRFQYQNTSLRGTKKCNTKSLVHTVHRGYRIKIHYSEEQKSATLNLW